MNPFLRALLATFVLSSSALAGANFQKASFSGFIGIGGSDPSEQGGVKVTTTATGGFTISGKVGSRGFSTKGTFDSNGHVEKEIKITFLGRTIATIELILDLAMDGESIVGSVEVDGNTYPFTIYRAFYSRDNPPGVAGYFTVLLPSPGGNFPGGTGRAAVTISTSGGVKVAGKLADNSTLSTGGSLSKGDVFPVFAILYKKRGAIGGFVDFNSNDTATGNLAWVRLDAATPDVLTPPTFSGNIAFNVQRYAKPDTNVIALPGLNGTGDVDVTLTGGNLDTNLAADANIGTNNKLTVVGTNGEKLKVSIKSKTGLVSGSAKLAIGGITKARTFLGVIVQTTVNPRIEGYFLGGDKSGVFKIEKD